MKHYAPRWGSAVADRLAELYKLIADMEDVDFDKCVALAQWIASMDAEQRHRLFDVMG